MPPSVYLIASLAVLFAQSSGPAARTERDAFERARRSVFVVETESGHGSGFLVDARGLIITNHHVVGKTSYLAIGVSPDRKYPAVVVARDASQDLALIRVHPQAVAGLAPLRFIDSAAVNVGERVLAIGSALGKEGAALTTGIVSRLEANTIFADVNVNPGNSGGPLLNLNGEVVGVCTFYVKAPAGPGLAGIVRSHVVRPIVATAAASLTPEPPPFEQLPVASPTPYPADALRERAAGIRGKAVYGTTLRGMRIDVLTPPVVYYEAHEMEFRQAQKYAERHGRATQDEPERPSYAWHAYVGQVEAIIGIRAVPEVIELGDSARDEEAEPPSRTLTKRRVRFTSDVRDMRLLRNGVEVVPIVPGRFCSGAADAAQLRPSGCFGLYQYSPSAFAPGAELELRVYSVDAPTRPRIWKLPAGLVSRVWADFEPWLSVTDCTEPCR